MADIQVVTQDFVNVHITKSDSEDAAPVERRFKKAITVAEFKVTLIYRFFYFCLESLKYCCYNGF